MASLLVQQWRRRLSDSFKPRRGGRQQQQQERRQNEQQSSAEPPTPTSVADFPCIVEFEKEKELDDSSRSTTPIIADDYNRQHHHTPSPCPSEEFLEYPFLPHQHHVGLLENRDPPVIPILAFTGPSVPVVLDREGDDSSAAIPEPTPPGLATTNDHPVLASPPEEVRVPESSRDDGRTSQTASSANSNQAGARPQYVSICKGKNKGNDGSIVGMYDKRTYRILLDRTGEIVNVRITSTEPMPSLHDNTNRSCAAGDIIIDTSNNKASFEESKRSSVEQRNQEFLGTNKKNTVKGSVATSTASHHHREWSDEPSAPIGLTVATDDNNGADIFDNKSDNKENAMVEYTNEQKVRIIAGQHRSKVATLVGAGSKKNLVRVLLENGTVCEVRHTSIDGDIDTTNELSRRQQLPQLPKLRVTTRRRKSPRSGTPQILCEQALPWSIPGTLGNAMTFGGIRVFSIRLDDSPPTEITMLGELFGERYLPIQRVLNGRTNQKALAQTFFEGNVKYELIAVKVTDVKEGGLFGKKQIMNCGYLRTEGPGLPPLDLQNVLLGIADFSRLPPRKIVSRLELFLSPARFNVYCAKGEDFAMIPETGNVGCGFISEEKLFEICSEGGMGKAAASRVVAIQVRIFFPAMGVFKGVLVRKRTTAAPIELPPSMQKVPASTHDNAWDGKAAIVVCKNGVHPSPSSANEYIGRALDESRTKPPIKSFEAKIIKELKDMILRLWESMGVPRNVCQKYFKESIRVDRRNHAWIVGVADPTGSLPPDTVFVPGMKTIRPETIFVTRSPCVKYDDGRLLQQVVQRPVGMTNDDWEWLNGLPFGCIFFSNPKDGMMSMPERIAIGDLDGDLYLVCWDEEIVGAMNAAALPARPAEDDGKLSTIDADIDWLKHAQELMQDVGSLNDMGKLTGKLYCLGEKLARNSVQGLRDPDVAAFFDAFNQALEYKKHGRPIVLPRHLHTMVVPPQLRRLLTNSDTQ